MNKFLLISVILGSLVFGQKNNKPQREISPVLDTKLDRQHSSVTVPRRLSYQGLLTKTNGRAVNDGTYQVIFKLFKEIEGGLSYWEETQSLVIEDGVLSAVLGGSIPIDNVPENSFLEISIDGATLSPRQEMTSVFYSVVSDTAKYAQRANYNDLDGAPDLSVYAEMDTLSFYATTDTLSFYSTTDTLSSYVRLNEFDSISFSGNYSDLEGTPDLSEVLQSDTLEQYTLTSNLSLVALSNDYNELTNLPDLTQYAISIDLSVFISNDTLENFARYDSLGNMAKQNYDNVNITGGEISGIVDIEIADGGTGASDNSTARSNLGLEIGVDIQAFDSDLADLADGSLSAEKVQYLDNVTSDVQEQLNDINENHNHDLDDLGVSADSTELNYVDGVTSNIQVQLDSKQAVNDNLTTIVGLEHNSDYFIVSDGTNWTTEGGEDARTSLGLGTIATQDESSVEISGGSISGITDISISDGGTGASDISTARINLGLEIGVDVQAYDADLADLADGELSASKVEFAIRTEGESGQVWTSDGDGIGEWAAAAPLTGAGSSIDTEDLEESRALVSN